MRTSIVLEQFMEWYGRYVETTEWRSIDRAETARRLIMRGMRTLREELKDEPGIPPAPPPTIPTPRSKN